MTELVELLRSSAAGDRSSYEAAYAQIYPALKRLARRQKADQFGTPQPGTTSLVNDACIRLLRGVAAEDETHFYSIAARAMRHVLIDQARARQAGKRGPRACVDCEAELLSNIGVPGPEPVDLLAVDQAMQRLERIEPRLARLVELHCFGGLSMDELGRVLGISSRTARREWRRARAFLVLQLQGTPDHARG